MYARHAGIIRTEKLRALMEKGDNMPPEIHTDQFLPTPQRCHYFLYLSLCVVRELNKDTGQTLASEGYSGVLEAQEFLVRPFHHLADHALFT